MKLYIQSNKERTKQIAASSFVKKFYKKDIFFIEFEKFNILKKLVRIILGQEK